ncbi:flagellar basal body P-ring protein FlgI [Stratiformator vulcanicus]|uniref:Flagellar basal body P-ring protein n=1 Tax=Stratiformator vulcanicus TaxID=2527980 RepID=A0A517R7D5_9PLAN|nr:flagellar basal body P-ring protein FlgI [Stratiformator vulcanicus]QDT39804.1 flagellar basal body P-ring protein [Stratiformator vulcanicus]
MRVLRLCSSIRFAIGLPLVLVTGCTTIGLSALEWATPPKPSELPWMKPAAEPVSAEEILGEVDTATDTPLIGEYTSIAGLSPVFVAGVGLVVNLDGTGDDPPPSRLRTALMTEMKRREIESPNRILRSPNTALVVVSGFLPPLIRKGENFDIEVRLPPNSSARSLAGGTLLVSHLYEAQKTQEGRTGKGHEMALATGPVLISTGVGGDDIDLAGVLRRGRIVGGGTSKIDRALSVFLRNEYRTFRNSQRVAHRIGKRFHAPDEHGLKKPLAEAKTDQRVQVALHPLYERNYARFLQVIRAIAFKESTIARRVRLRKLDEMMQVSETSAEASLQLEAIGEEAIPILLDALDHESLEVRFYAASALVYLENSEGLKTLAEAARSEPAFRIFALTALSVSKEAEASMLLRDLLSESSAETRYGAFRALTAINADDPLVRGEPMFGGRKPDLGEEPSYRLHVLPVDGPSLIHLTHRTRAEVVLFGADQQMKLPLALRAGNHIIVSAPPGSSQVSVSRFQVGRPDQKEIVSANVADIIRACDSLGASYPDIAALLAQADRQGNLPGAIAVDELPKAGRLYYRSGGGEFIGGPRQTRVGSEGTSPNLFPVDGEASEQTDEIDDAAEEMFLDLGETRDGKPDADDDRNDDRVDDRPDDIDAADDEAESSSPEANDRVAEVLDEYVSGNSNTSKASDIPETDDEGESSGDYPDAPSQSSSFRLPSFSLPSLPRIPGLGGGGVPTQSEPELPPQDESE